MRLTLPSLVCAAMCLAASARAETLADADARAVDVITSGHMSAATWTFSAGVDFSRGTYGASPATEVVLFPFGVTYRDDSWTLSLESGVAMLSGPVTYADINNLTRAEVAALNPTPETNSGLADLITGARYALLEFGSTFVDLGAHLQIPTASEENGLSNGNLGADIELDVTQLLGPWTAFASAIYGFRDHGNGDRDTQSVSIGIGRPITERISAGIVYDWRTSPHDGNGAGQEGMAYVAYDVTETVSMTAYAVHGFTESSPDIQVGLRLNWRLW